jgi:hypothetical protein
MYMFRIAGLIFGMLAAFPMSLAAWALRRMLEGVSLAERLESRPLPPADYKGSSLDPCMCCYT